MLQDKNISHWSNEETLSKEFESMGFYISNHPLKDFEDILRQYKVKSYSDFENSTEMEALISGTIMSIKEKKNHQGNQLCYY